MRGLLILAFGLVAISFSVAENSTTVLDADDPLTAADDLLARQPVVRDTELTIDHEGIVRAQSERIRCLDELGHLRERIGDRRLKDWSFSFLKDSVDPDENMIVLRNLAWADEDSHLFVADQLRKILTEPQETGKSRFAIIQAMDGVVFLGDASFVPDLAAFLEDPRLEVVAAQSLDRLAERSPLNVARKLNARPHLLSDRPLLVADYFAKLDVSNDDHRVEMERFLSRKDVRREAKEKLIRGLGASSQIFGGGLFTGTGSPPAHEIGEEAVIRILEAWLDDSRFSALRAVLLESLAWWRDSQ